MDPYLEAVKYKIKLSNKSILVNNLAYNNFIWTKKGVIINECKYCNFLHSKVGHGYVLQDIVEMFCSLILRNHWTWKVWDCLTGLGLVLWCIGLELKKYWNYLNRLRLIFWYIGVRFEKYTTLNPKPKWFRCSSHFLPIVMRNLYKKVKMLSGRIYSWTW